MAHGFINYRGLKHGQVLDFAEMQNIRQIGTRQFYKNYRFIWDVYKEVADAHGIKIPFRWVYAELMQRKHRYRKRRHNYYILEPMGPVIHVNGRFNTNHLFDAANSTEASMFGHNWYKSAENFFMVGGTAANALNLSIEPGLICEKWRVLDLKTLTPEE